MALEKTKNLRVTFVYGYSFVKQRFRTSIDQNEPKKQIQVPFKPVKDDNQFYNAYAQYYIIPVIKSDSQTQNFTKERCSDVSSKRLYHEPLKQDNFNYRLPDLNDNHTKDINSSPQNQPANIFNTSDYQIHSPFQQFPKKKNKIDKTHFKEPKTLNTIIPEYSSTNLYSKKNDRTLNPILLSDLQKIDEVNSYRVSKSISRNDYHNIMKYSFTKKDKPCRYRTKTPMDIKLTRIEVGVTLIRNKVLTRGKKRTRRSKKHIIFKI